MLKFTTALFRMITAGAKRTEASVTSLFTKIKEYLGIYSPIYKLPDPRMPGVVPDILAPFELVGENWYRPEDLPLAIFWGFNPWKRPYMQAYFPEHKLAFVRGARGYIRLSKFLRNFPAHRECVFIGWGLKLPKFVERYARRHKITVRYVEDGFLRSFNPGALHTKPWSLTIDSQAPYYATRRPTDLQDLLTRAMLERTHQPCDDKAGEAGVALMRAARLTKYFSLKIGDEVWTPPSMGGRKIVLVLGQVEDDAAISAGYARHFPQPRFSNLLVVEKAAKDHPDSCILYRPHPDTFHSGRKSLHEKKIARICTIIDPTIPLHAVFPHLDHVYSGTSLAAFEAALWGIPVTTLGLPFYAASPAITNLQGPVNGFARLSIPQLFSVIYLEYPRYIHPDSDEAATFFDLASYFIVEKFKHLVLSGVPTSVLDIATLAAHEAYLTSPAKLLLHLLRLGRTGRETPEEIVALAGNPLRYGDIPQFSELLIKACRFDSLALYLECVVSQFTRDIEHLKSRKTLMTKVMEILIENEKILRGRIGVTLPDFADWIAPRRFDGYVIPEALLLAYARALSNNLQYEILEQIIANMEFSTREADIVYGPSILRAFAALLIEIPARSERHAGKRAELKERIGRLYHESLLTQAEPDPLFARALTDMAMDRVHNCEATCREMLARLEAEKAQGKSQLLANFQRKTPSVLSLVTYLTRQSMHETVDCLMAFLGEENDLIRVQQLRICIERQEFEKFHSFYASLPDALKARSDINDLQMRAFIDQGDFLSAQEVTNRNLALTTLSRKKRASLYEQKEKLAFSLEASRILDAVPQPHLPKGVVFLGAFTDYRTIAMLTPALMEVKRKGYAVISLINGVLRQTHTGLDYVDQFIGAISAATADRKEGHHNEWTVNWDNKIVSSGGINYYQGFYEAISNFFRRYDIDLNDEAIRRNFFKRLILADDSLNVCNRLVRDVISRGMPSILLSGAGHIVPQSIFRDFAMARNHPLLSYVNVNIGYESYFTNLGGRYASSMTVSDMTLFPEHRAPFLARRDRFEQWYARERDNPDYRKRAEELINFNRVHAKGDAASRALAAYLQAERAGGRKIVACLGKIPIDLGVPYDGGPGHEDLRDWLNHTIESVRDAKDILLLIKPHPHELQPSIALDLVDRFADLIRVPMPENVRILGHREINNHQLAPYLDLALMWNGSSSLELTAMGVPVMMAGHFARHDYPVDLLYPRDREQYRAFIAGGDWPKPDVEIRHKAACLIAYMETPDVNIRNDYAWRPVTNDSVGVPTWRADRVAQLMRDGDPEMVRAAARILERFEGECE